MGKKIWLILWLLSVAAILFGSLMPGNVTSAIYDTVTREATTVKANSPALHFIGHAFFYMCSGFVLSLWLNGFKSLGWKRKLCIILIFAVVLGFGLEFAQRYIVPRSFARQGMNPDHALANCLGAVCGWLLFQLVSFLSGKINPHSKVAGLLRYFNVV